MVWTLGTHKTTKAYTHTVRMHHVLYFQNRWCTHYVVFGHSWCMLIVYIVNWRIEIKIFTQVLVLLHLFPSDDTSLIFSRFIQYLSFRVIFFFSSCFALQFSVFVKSKCFICYITWCCKSQEVARMREKMKPLFLCLYFHSIVCGACVGFCAHRILNTKWLTCKFAAFIHIFWSTA